MITKLNIITLTLILTWLPVTLHASDPSPDPILRIETGMHTARITRISVDAAERFLLTTSDDKTLRLWDLSTGELLNVYRVPIAPGNEGKLYSGAISPDGEWVVGGGWTGAEWDNQMSIYLFQRASGKLVRRLSGLKEIVDHLCFSPDGQYLGASLGDVWEVRIWQTQTWQLIFTDKDYADSSYGCSFNRQNRMVTTSNDGYLRLYSFQNGDFTLVIKNQTPGGQQPFAAVFSPEGDKIAVGFTDSAKVNVLDGNTLALLYAPDTTGIDSGQLANVAWSPDGDNLYAGGSYSDVSGMRLVLTWPQGGPWSSYTTLWQASQSSIYDLRSLKKGRIIYGAADPAFAVFDNLGNKLVERKGSIADFIS